MTGRPPTGTALALALLVACGASPGGPGTGDSAMDPGRDVPEASEPAAWGWISVLELNDVCEGPFPVLGWMGGVRAYFADAPSYPRALPHHLGFLEVADRDGPCTLYQRADLATMGTDPKDCMTFADITFECWRDCGPDQQCERTDPQVYPTGECRDLPRHWSAGTITLAGLKRPIAMDPGELDLYRAEAPGDLFDEGDVVTAATTGGDLAPVALSAKGVAPLEPEGAEFRLPIRRGKPATIAWKAGAADTRVQLYLASGSHDPNPVIKAMLCDAPDRDGRIEISARLADAFMTYPCSDTQFLSLQKCNRITRYTRDAATSGGGEIELFVGSARNVLMLWE